MQQFALPKHFDADHYPPVSSRYLPRPINSNRPKPKASRLDPSYVAFTVHLAELGGWREVYRDEEQLDEAVETKRRAMALLAKRDAAPIPAGTERAYYVANAWRVLRDGWLYWVPAEHVARTEYTAWLTKSQTAKAVLACLPQDVADHYVTTMRAMTCPSHDRPWGARVPKICQPPQQTTDPQQRKV